VGRRRSSAAGSSAAAAVMTIPATTAAAAMASSRTLEDRHRHAFFHPVLRQGQRRLAELARGNLDGHRRWRGPGNDIHPPQTAAD
jgi:hypothetical protein